MKPQAYKWLNAALFQLGWFCCILGSNLDALVVTIIIIGVHLALIKDRRNEIIFIIQVAIAGFSLDYMVASLGYIRFTADNSFPWYMICLWLLFAMTLKWSYTYLVSRPAIAIISGLIAPLSYFAAQKIGRVEYLKSTVECFIVHALVWISFLVFIHFIEFNKEPIPHAR